MLILEAGGLQIHLSGAEDLSGRHIPLSGAEDLSGAYIIGHT